VYEFIAAEDVVLHFLKASPALLNYDMEVGPWNHIGATRITHFEGASRAALPDSHQPHSIEAMFGHSIPFR
jgi:hypothetical protein